MALTRVTANESVGRQFRFYDIALTAFVVILLLFAGSNALAAAAPNIWVLGLGRFIPALALPS